MQDKGWLRVVGLGPGDPGGNDPGWLTGETAAILAEATDLIGYDTYLARLPERDGQIKHATPNRVEVQRAQHALMLTASGRKVAVVSGGDPGIFAMASAVMEAIDAGDPAWRLLDVAVAPGISAFQAVAARCGALVGGDFAVISLSDNLKPRQTILKRLRAVLATDMVVALYNPASAARPDWIHEVIEAVRSAKLPETLIVKARAIGGAGERLEIVTLAKLQAEGIDMRTLLVVGSSETRRIERPGHSPLIYTARSVGRL
jgi:precorrin-3B C17-methyltransferase